MPLQPTAAAVATYELLAPIEQKFLRFMTIAATPINRHQLTIFDKANLAGTKTNGYSHKAIVQLMEMLLTKHLLIKNSDGFVININIADYLVRQTLDFHEHEDFRKAINDHFKSTWSWYRNDKARVMEFFEAFYQGQESRADERYTNFIEGSFPLLDPFDGQRLAALPKSLQSIYARHTIGRILGGFGRIMTDADPVSVAALQQLLEKDLVPYADPRLQASVLEWALASGNRQLLGLLDEVTGGKALDVAGCRALLDGDHERAVKLLAKTTAKKASVKCITENGRLPSVFYFLLRLSGGCGPLTSELSKAIDLGRRLTYSCPGSFELLRSAFSFRNKSSTVDTQEMLCKRDVLDPFDFLTSAYLGMWLQIQRPSNQATLFQKSLVEAERYFRTHGCCWLASELAHFAGLETKQSEPADCQNLANSLKPRPEWEQRLQAIMELVAPGSSALSSTDTDGGFKDRLIFELNILGSSIDLDAFQQTLKGRHWSKGRKVNLKRLMEDSSAVEFAFLSDKDRDVIRSFQIKKHYSGFGVQDVVDINPITAMRALVGHPLVFRPGDRDQPIEITEIPPRLIVEKIGAKEVQLRLEPAPKTEQSKLLLHSQSPGKVLVTFFNDATVKLQQRLGPGLKLPHTAIDQLSAILRPLSSVVMVHSEIEMGDGPSAENHANGLATAEVVEGKRTPFVHLFPSGGGYFLDIFVHPFGETGPSCRPGEGGTKLFANLEGKPWTANRDLAAEIEAANLLLDRCPHTRSWLQSPWSATMPTPIDALEVLLELESAAADGQCQVMWPQGKALRLAGQVGSSNLQVRIKKDHDWFAASGTLQVAPDHSLDMMKLIDLAAANPGRFVQLDDGRFLALTEQLRRQIDEFSGFGDRRKAGAMRFPAAHAGMFENLTDVKIKSDSHWQSMLERMRAAQQLDTPTPAGFLAELRDYQEDGYKWMARLAAWGVGGCLADDMGLGKTIQAMALLLNRATGPALVIAPTSVVFNWAAEIQRFAPTLRPRLVADEATSDELADLQANDVVLCSYGLLQHRAAMLKATSWNTLILDEAQAIKNASTQRSQSAKSLTANFRLIMTGTPIENHLGELWNLMDFINPGMLGSAEVFQQRFATPIERDQCRQTKSRLKKLISPFLLRRTKAQVLSELPSRTEITLHVQLNPQEVAFYEAIRRKAIEKLADSGAENNSHLKILAEIMRLRRACCHPTLVVKDAEIECSKLKLFLETVEELRAGGHKALVFSQFVDHLAILRSQLDQRQIAYQYLDGSTPAKQRKKNVEAFQAGEGDLFLISLKAGGSGLNLTAADYVLHMDPWWNPAVEDQASDRAHRLGQQRPVTIYRFITEGTIEQKIQQLHGSKRDLADSLLEGAERSGKLSAEELLALLRS
jgi:superfamily II DNA or RNA helicase